MPTYKLKYFNGRGAAEVSRLMFAIAGQQFEDLRFDSEGWKKEKENTPFGQLPVLEIDGVQYAQSSAIARYLARTFGFYGKDDLEVFRVDVVLGIYQDIIMYVLKARFEKDETRMAEYIKENREVKMPQFFGMLEKIITSNGNSGHYVGSSTTLADVTIFDLCDKIGELVDLEKYPLVKKNRDMVGANSNIKAWVDKRPATDF